MLRGQIGWLVLLVAVGQAAACGGGSSPAGSADARGDGGPPGHDGAVSDAPDLPAGDVRPDAHPIDGSAGPGDTRPAPDVAPDLATSACLLAKLESAGEAPPPDVADLPGAPVPITPAPPPPHVRGDPGKLTPQEVADRLARFIWRMPADAQLLARVAGCSQLTVDDVLILARQMARDPRAARGVQDFVSWWLQLDRLTSMSRDPGRFPAFSPALRQSMFEEPRLFASHVMFNDHGTLDRLLTAPYSFVDNQLAGVYGAPLLDDSFRMVSFPLAEQRAGILTQPGVLAAAGGPERHSGPIRAAWLMDRIMCTPVPPPPAGIMNQPPPESARPGQSLRQAIEELSLQNPACAACHQMMQLGFALEPFDAIGRRRTTDNGAPINAFVSVTSSTTQAAAQIAGPVDLMTWLASEQAVRKCFSRRWLEFAVGRALDGPEFDFVVQSLTQQFNEAGLQIRELIAQVTITAPFLAPR